MENSSLTQFIAGALTMGYAVAGVFFLRFWKQSEDRLFAIFAAAFILLAVQRAALAVFAESIGSTTWLYMLRLVAFLLILYAIIDKNRPRTDH